MSASPKVDSLLDQWFELTQAEGTAIQNADWEQVQQAQAGKARLHHFLSEQRARLGDIHPFASRIARLISLESRNEELLAAQMRRWHSEKEQLEQGTKNLRRIQRSYAPARSGARWNFYS